MSFDSHIMKGVFGIPKCARCATAVWPPSEFCSHCLGPVSVECGDFEGVVLEWSADEKGYFCLVEFEGAVRIMASMESEPRVGQTVRMKKCSVSSGRHKFHVG